MGGSLSADRDLHVCTAAVSQESGQGAAIAEITISAEKSEHKVIIQFQNSGEDIPSEALASLFDKFYRADKSRSSDTGGTGLGLAIAKEIVMLHGGTISAASKNHVVTFTISLPLAH